MKTIAAIVNWIVGLFFVSLALASITYQPMISIPCVILAGIYLPPVRRYAHEKTGKSFRWQARRVVIIVLIVTSVVLARSEEYQRGKEREAAALQKIIKVYKQNKAVIIDSIKTAINSGEYEAAIAQIDRYTFVDDSLLVNIKRDAETKKEERDREIMEQELLSIVKTVPATEYARNAELYSGLMGLNPANETYKKKYNYYFKKLSEQKTEQQRATARKKKIEGGLVQGTVLDWRRASYQDRISACEEIVKTVSESDAFWRRFSSHRLRYAAEELEKCISIAADVAPSSMSIAEMGVTCLMLMKSDS